MTFVYPKYESSELALVIQAKMSVEELAVAGPPPGADQDASLTCYGSGSRRRHGIHARGVVCTRQSGTAPDIVTRRRFVTILTQSALNALSIGGTLSIDGIDWTIRSKVPEVAV